MTRKRRPRTIVPALERSIKAAPWIEATDEGAHKTAVRLADDLDRIDHVLAEIDRGSMFGDPKVLNDLIGKRAYLAGTLLPYLRQLGLTPETRRGGDDDGQDALAILRRLVESSPGDVPGDGGDAPDVQNVDDGGAPGPIGDLDSPDPDPAG